jgi:hypothetical protein
MEVHNLKTPEDFLEQLEYMKLKIDINEIPKNESGKIYPLKDEQIKDLKKYRYLDLNKTYDPENVLYLRINGKELSSIKKLSTEHPFSKDNALGNAFVVYTNLKNNSK